MSYLEFLKRALLLVAVAVLPVLIWYLFGVVLIAIGARTDVDHLAGAKARPLCPTLTSTAAWSANT